MTGVAGFIGSNLLERLLTLNQTVVGIDNFSTGRRHNLQRVEEALSPEQWSRFQFYEADIRSLEDCRVVCENIDCVLHQAALGSVPRSLVNPILTNDVNVGGFLNMLISARDSNVKSFVYAASSSTYGDHPALPKKEDVIGNPLSPYAVTKLINELYASVVKKSYGFTSIGLRYFNVFGKRQDPEGAYAAVIPKWIAAMIAGESVTINGDGSTSRDFCYIENVIQANLLAASKSQELESEIFNVAVGQSTTLLELFELLKGELRKHGIAYDLAPEFVDFRVGDVHHSLADIGRARDMLGYAPVYTAAQGLSETMRWYIDSSSYRSAQKRVP